MALCIPMISLCIDMCFMQSQYLIYHKIPLFLFLWRNVLIYLFIIFFIYLFTYLFLSLQRSTSDVCDALILKWRSKWGSGVCSHTATTSPVSSISHLRAQPKFILVINVGHWYTIIEERFIMMFFWKSYRRNQIVVWQYILLLFFVSLCQYIFVYTCKQVLRLLSFVNIL